MLEIGFLLTLDVWECGGDQFEDVLDVGDIHSVSFLGTSEVAIECLNGLPDGKSLWLGEVVGHGIRGRDEGYQSEC